MIDQTYDSFIKMHGAYEKKALSILLKELRSIFRSINFKNLTFNDNQNLATIEININKEKFEKILYKIHYTIGSNYGNIISRQLRAVFPLQKKKWNPLPFFNEAFRDFLLSFYSAEGAERITLLSRTISSSVVEEIKRSTYERETIDQMRDRIYKTVNKSDFYKWQALRIARTETSFAMNSSKFVSGDVSGVIMEKVWIGRNDGRERDSHLMNNGKKISKNDFFYVGDSKMLYPCDADNGASANELINCRCTIGWEAKRDVNGNLMFTDELAS